jgi:hypothetical protein
MEVILSNRMQLITNQQARYIVRPKATFFFFINIIFIYKIYFFIFFVFEIQLYHIDSNKFFRNYFIYSINYFLKVFHNQCRFLANIYNKNIFINKKFTRE